MYLSENGLRDTHIYNYDSCTFLVLTAFFFIFFAAEGFVSSPLSPPLSARARAALARSEADLMMSLTWAWSSEMTLGDSPVGPGAVVGADFDF